MANRYFRKTNTRNRILFGDSNFVNWEPIPGDEGVRKLDPSDDNEAVIIKVLEEKIEAGIGGVTEIDASTYKDLKKNYSAKGWGTQQVIDHTSLQRQAEFPKRPFGMPADRPVVEQLTEGRSHVEPAPTKKASNKPRTAAPPKPVAPPAPESGTEDF